MKTRLICLFLSLVMLVGMLPAAYATEETETTQSTETTAAAVEPTGETTAPTEVTTAPTEETTAPTEETTAPTEETVAPTEVTTAPTEETTAPTEEATAPTEETTAPTEATTAPTEETTASTEETTIPAEVSVLSVDLQASCGENLTWELDAEGTLTISGTGEMTNYTSATETPWYADRAGIQKIVVAEGVTSIGDYAFSGFVALTDVSLPQSLTRIGSWSFSNCYDLASVTIPVNVTEIGYKAFDFYGAKMVRVICLGDVPQTPYGYPFFERSGYGFVINIFYDVSNSSWTEEAKQAFSSSGSTKLNYIPCSNMSSTSGTCGDGLTWSVDLDKKALTISGSGIMDDWGESSAAPWNCFADLLELVVVEEGVSNIGENAFTYVKSTSYQFQGTVPAGIETVLEGKDLTVYYPADDGDWQNLKTQYSAIKWIANGSAQASLDELMVVYKTMTPAEIRAAVQSWDRDELREMLFSGENSLDLSYLEGAVCPEYPAVYITENVPKLAGVGTSPVMFGVQGARLNNLLDESQVPTLTLDQASSAIPVPAGYLSDSAVQFSIQLGNLENPENLAVPISINIVLPDDMNPFFQGLFWRNPQTGEVEALPMDVYWSKTGGMRTGFVITGAGDYVFAQKADAKVSGTCGNNLTWTYDSSYTLTISGTGDMDNYNESDNLQPWYKYGESITRIVLEEGVTSIGAYAFDYNCRFAKWVTIPASVEQIGSNAFSSISSMARLIFQGNVPNVAEDSFLETSMIVYYPGDDESWSAVIDNPQWGGAEEITWMEMGHSGVCGDNLLWEWDEETETLTISGTGNMWNYSSLVSDQNPPPWSGFEDQITNVVLEDGVTNIGSLAFGACVNLRQITISDTVTEICEFGIHGSSLEELHIPKGVTRIDPLSGIGGVGKISVAEENTCYFVVDGVLFSKDGPTLVKYLGGNGQATYVVPDGTCKLGMYSFSGDDVLENLILPDTLTTIETYALNQAHLLRQIEIPEGVTNIGYAAFACCENLKEITFKGDAPEIGRWCFDSVNATAYYPAGNDTWTEEVRQGYGGTLTWVSYEPGSGSVEENLESLLNNAGSLSSEEIRKEVQAMDRDELAGAMEGENSAAAETIKKLESQLDVKTEVQSGIAEITGSQVSVVGAGLNNVIQEGTDIVLTIAAPSSDELDVPPEYDQKTVLAFSMTLENVEDTSALTVPVKITLPVPAEMDPERLVLLHFHNGSQTPDVIIPEISEKDGNSYASFVLTGFSDFVMTQFVADEPETTQPMYRLYNPYTLEHLFTSGEWEKDNLPNAGWLYEGVAWEAPTTGTPIYRLYNPYSDSHFYTASEAEIDTLLPLGWQMDGVVTYGADSSGTPIYRLFNPYETKNYHHYTTSWDEINMLTGLGWILEGVAWYAA